MITGCFGDFRRFNEDNSSTRGPDKSRPSELVYVGVSEIFSLELDVIFVYRVVYCFKESKAGAVNFNEAVLARFYQLTKWFFWRNC